MGMMKHYLLSVLEAAADHDFGQNAVEYAINTGKIELTYDLAIDTNAIAIKYDDIITAYRSHVHQTTATVDLPVPTNQRRKAPTRTGGQQLILRTQS